MGKLKLIIIAIATTLITIGVSYAAWSQQVLVTGNAKTGVFDVVFTDDYQMEGDEFLKTSAQLSPDKKTINVKAENLYPGTMFWLDFGVMNAGTVPAKFQEANITFNGNNPDIQKYLNFYCWYDYFDDKMVWKDGGFIADFNSDGTKNKLSDISSFFLNNTKFMSTVLNPGEFFYFDKPAGQNQYQNNRLKRRCIMIELDPDTPDTYENSIADFSLELFWRQAL